MSGDITNNILSFIVWQLSHNLMNFNISLQKPTKIAFYSIKTEINIEKLISVILGNLLHKIFDFVHFSA